MQGEDPYKKTRRNYANANKNYKSKNNDYKNTKSKSGSKERVVFKIIAIICIIMTIVFYISVIRLNLLPNSYITIFTIAEVIFTLLIVIGLGKTHKTKKLNIFCLIIALLVSGIYLYVTNYVNATSDFLDSMF